MDFSPDLEGKEKKNLLPLPGVEILIIQSTTTQKHCVT
jgi:hypothetical protein